MALALLSTCTMSLRLLIPTIALALVAALAAVPEAEACSIASDFATPPQSEQAYDAGQAPAAPTMVDAYVSHNYSDDPPGCGGMSSCGDIHGLHLVVTGVEENHLLRLTHEDGSVAYTTLGWTDGEGNQQIFLPGYADVEEDLQLSIAIINEAGYPSEEVTWDADNQQDNDPGCTAGGGNAAGLTTSLLVFLALMGWRRKRLA